MATIDPNAFIETHRQFDEMMDFVSALRVNTLVWSWGAMDWIKVNSHCLRFRVNGHHHKGHVYLVVNAADLFEIYLTTLKGEIKKEIKDIYIENLIEAIDIAVEKIPAYKR